MLAANAKVSCEVRLRVLCSNAKGSFMRLILACLLLLAVSATPSVADTAIDYSMSPVVSAKGLSALAIQIRMDGDDDGDTVLNLPNEWGGKTKLYEGIKDLRIAGGDIVPQKDPAKRFIHHRPRAKLFISYKVVQTWPGEAQANGANEYRPIIQPGYFHVLGNAVFITPERDDHPPASFAMNGLPAGWSFASDLEHGVLGRKLVLDDVPESILVGGDFRVVTRNQVRLAIRGKWPFTDDALVTRLQAIIDAHQRFWGDPSEPFLVTALPLVGEPGVVSLGGTGRSDAFAFFATDSAESEQINKVLAHEHLHTWIPRRIGGMPKEDEARDYWLSEGFTEFYTTRLLLRYGQMSMKAYVDNLNDALRDYANSSVRTAPNSKIVSDFWKDRNTEQLPYQRGQLLAHLWDQRLRDRSDGALDLDDVVLAMKARVKSLAGRDPPLASDLFPEEARRLGLDLGFDLERLVRDGGAVLLDADTFQPCGKVETVDLPEYDRGFDADKTADNGNVVAGLREDSNAFKAGLRNGMKILKRETGKPGDSRVPLTYRVQDGGRETVISFLPEGDKRTTLQELVLKPDLDWEFSKMCLARLSGLPGRFDDGVWSKVRRWLPF